MAAAAAAVAVAVPTPASSPLFALAATVGGGVAPELCARALSGLGVSGPHAACQSGPRRCVAFPHITCERVAVTVVQVPRGQQRMQDVRTV